ncbi:MAG: HAD-IA family hydrolase [Paludibacteraceae bacterium]|nr:HAD-IA family hydrolase [Paludibacteraceae bacterium]
MAEELFPLVDVDGRVIGSASRKDCHSGSFKLHPVVHLHVFNSRGELYLQKRSMSKDIQPGKWDTSVGGHVDYGESVKEALLREAREELGIESVEVHEAFRYDFRSKVEYELVNAYWCIYDGPITPDPVEVEEGRFWPLHEIRMHIGYGVFTPNFEQEFGRLMTVVADTKFLFGCPDVPVKNMIFDFGAVLVDWNPHYVFDPYFGSTEKTDRFIREVCTIEWNGEVDRGKPIRQATDERIALFPEWEKEIRMYFDEWIHMIGDALPGMAGLIRELKAKGYGVYGLSNWARETFRLVEDRFEAFGLLDGYIISGDAHLLKPEPEIYRLLLQRYGLQAQDCLFVDDNATNIVVGESQGIRGIRFTSPEALRDELCRRHIR